MRRWSFAIGAALVLLGLLSILNAILGISLHIFWPIVLIAVGAWIILGITRGRPNLPREQASVPLEGAREAAVTIHHGAGRLSVGAGPVADLLLSGSFGGGLEVSRRMEGDRLVADLKIRDRDPSRYIFGPWRGGWAGWWCPGSWLGTGWGPPKKPGPAPPAHKSPPGGGGAGGGCWTGISALTPGSPSPCKWRRGPARPGSPWEICRCASSC